MLFKKIVFDNYKTYYGTQKIDLYIPQEIREKEGKNIILFGGLNGAGKTTILKAIKDVLYGKREFNENEEEYKKVFSNVINNTFFDEGGRECSVSLVIETDSGEEWTIKVKWYFNSNKMMTMDEREIIVDSPNLYKPRKSLVESMEQYNRLIDRIIPYYASPFFIFDGEEVKEIIIRQEQSEMKEAIHKITGMNSYKQLIKDLYTLKSNIELKIVRAQKGNQNNQLKEQLETINTKLEELEESRKSYLNKIKEYEEKASKTKLRRQEKLSLNSRSREEIVKRQSRLATEIEQNQRNLDSQLKENIIPIILRDKISDLKKQLKIENESRNARVVKQASLKPYYTFMESLLNANLTPALSHEQIEQIKKLGEDIWVNQNKITSSEKENIVEIHDVSHKDYHTIQDYRTGDRNNITQAIDRIERLQQTLESTEQELRNAPEYQETTEENEKIETYTKRIGEITLYLRSTNSKIQKYRDEKANIMNKLTRSSSNDGDLEELKKQLENTSSTIKALEKYIEQVTTLKANFIKEEFSNMLLKLFRKQDEFGKIEFDIDSFSVRLYNDKMQEVSVNERSAGEMQMISSALIWALIKVSDLELPVVIDTPLGRLDSYHRNQLINHYYNELSNQVIILSTDTEITQDYVNTMKESSYKQYMLDYDETKKYTLIREGYFEFIGR